jgi:hypothetical protein
MGKKWPFVIQVESFDIAPRRGNYSLILILTVRTVRRVVLSLIRGGNYSAVLDGGSGHLRDLRRSSLSYSLISSRECDTCFHGLAILRDGATIAASDGRELIRWDLPESAFQESVTSPSIFTGRRFTALAC